MNKINKEELKDCTVKICHQRGKIHDGSGFFVASGLVLTCAHVCKKAKGNPIEIHWKGKSYPMKVKYCSDNIEELDLCLLELENSAIDTPFVYLDLNETIETGIDLYNFGYPEKYPQGDVATFKSIGYDGQGFLKFKEDLVGSGLSGSPLLNLNSGKVCAIIVITRDTKKNLGGRGIPTQTIFEHFPEVKEFQQSLYSKENPFLPLGGKIEDISLIFGRESEIDDIFEYLNSGSGVALIGESGMGKSSLLNAIKIQSESQLKISRKPIYLDFGGIFNDNDFYYQLCSKVGIDCNYENPPKGGALGEELEKHRLLFLLDGLRKDMVWEGFTNPVRNQLRALADKGKDSPLRLIVAADKPLIDLFADSGADSPFENVCMEVKLNPWDETTIRNFIANRLVKTNISFFELEIQEIIGETQGNPRKIMQKCYKIYQNYC